MELGDVQWAVLSNIYPLSDPPAMLKQEFADTFPADLVQMAL
jgi:hypothetical protein